MRPPTTTRASRLFPLLLLLGMMLCCYAPAPEPADDAPCALDEDHE